MLANKNIFANTQREEISIVLSILFVLGLIPFNVDNYSINYLSYIFLIPFFSISALSFKMSYMNLFIILFLSFSFINFVISLFYQAHEHLFRIVISYLLVIMPLCYGLLVKPSKSFLISLSIAIITFSVCYSIFKIYEFLILDFDDYGLFKKEIGTQRLGFFLIFAFSVFLYMNSIKKLKSPIIFIILIILLAGIFLSFSRTAYISFLVTILLSFYFKKTRWLIVAISMLFIILIYIFFYSSIFAFLKDRIFVFFLDGVFLESLKNEITSESIRLKIWTEMFGFVNKASPLTGTGFLGVWSISDFGSVHNEFFDRILRFGYPLVAIYFSIYFLLGYSLFKINKDIYIGFVSILVYSCFHETFSLYNGSFLLFYLIYFTRVCKEKIET